MRVGNFHDPWARVDVAKIPTERQTQSLRRNGAPSLLCASGTSTMTELMKNKLQTTQPRMMRMIKQTKMKPRKSPAAAHAANVRRGRRQRNPPPDSEAEDDTTEANPHDPNEQEKNSHDADCNSSFDGVPQDEHMRVDYTVASIPKMQTTCW